MTSTSMPTPIRAALALLLVAQAATTGSGCAAINGFSGGDDDRDAGGDGEADGGGGPNAADAGTDTACTAPDSMPAGLLVAGVAARDEDALAVFNSRDLSPPRDMYQLELWQNIAPFSGTLVPGTYVIEGTQTEYDTCGVCVMIYGDVESGDARQRYIAESGIVTIDYIDEFVIRGSITGASLVSFDPEPRGECQTYVGPTLFDAEIRPL